MISASLFVWFLAAGAAIPRTTGEQVEVLVIVLIGVTLLMLAVAGMGRLLARSHPVALVRQKKAVSEERAGTVPVAGDGISPQIMAVIAAAVHTVVREPHKITAIQNPKTPSVELLMQTWSIEGRRQIYSSHKVR